MMGQWLVLLKILVSFANTVKSLCDLEQIVQGRKTSGALNNLSSTPLTGQSVDTLGFYRALEIYAN